MLLVGGLSWSQPLQGLGCRQSKRPVSGQTEHFQPLSIEIRVSESTHSTSGGRFEVNFNINLLLQFELPAQLDLQRATIRLDP